MLKKICAFVTMSAVAMLFVGCVGSTGHLNKGFESVTKKEGSSANTVMQTVTAEATCDYLFGIALGTPELYAQSMAQLRADAKLDGKARAFANMSTDRTWWGFPFLYWVEKLTLTADVVEFQ